MLHRPPQRFLARGGSGDFNDLTDKVNCPASSSLGDRSSWRPTAALSGFIVYGLTFRQLVKRDLEAMLAISMLYR
jgi:hypothetical protein